MPNNAPNLRNLREMQVARLRAANERAGLFPQNIVNPVENAEDAIIAYQKKALEKQNVERVKNMYEDPYKFTVGADPELFLRRGQKYISAQGNVPGTKTHPWEIPGMKGFKLQADNVACEFNIPPASNPNEFSANISKALAYIRKSMAQRKLVVDIRASQIFDEDQLQSEGAREFGCDPDWNAWSLEENPKPDCNTKLRTAAGHVHIGFANPTDDLRIRIARLFDAMVTVPSLFVTEPNPRRTMYGRAGAFRPKPYGVECRSIEAFWITKATYRKKVWEGAKLAFHAAIGSNSGIILAVEELADPICEAINTHNLELAKHVLDHYPHVRFV